MGRATIVGAKLDRDTYKQARNSRGERAIQGFLYLVHRGYETDRITVYRIAAVIRRSVNHTDLTFIMIITVWCKFAIDHDRLMGPQRRRFGE